MHVTTTTFDRPERLWLVRFLRGAGRFLLGQPRTLAWMAPVTWAGLIWYLSSLRTFPAPKLPLNLSALWGNMMHPGAFGTLALLMIPVLPREEGAGGWKWTTSSNRAFVLVWLAVFTFALSDEVHQSFVPGRSPSLLDVLSDVVGAACVLVVVRYVGRPDARDAPLRALLLACGFVCLVAGTLSTMWDEFAGKGLWF